MEYRILTPLRTRINEIIALCHAHAEYEQSSYVKANKMELLSRDMWTQPPKLHCLVAESEGKYIGYITWMVQYSTWDAAEYLYMDCLYVEEEFRGLGIGEELVKFMKEFGQKKNIELVQWQTPTFNDRAMKFYKRMGAESKSKERFFLKI